MNNKSPQDLRTQIADALGLQKGGLPGVKAKTPANDHHYLVNEVMDYDTEKIITTQYLNFEEQLDNVVALFTSHMQAGFEYALGKRLDVVKPSDTIVVPVEQLAYNAAFAVNVHLQEQEERASEWLLGSKENHG